MKIQTIFKTLGLSALVAGSFTPTVFAAETSALLEEVVVTARKKAGSESLQDTPISATIYSAEKIELINAVDIRDLGASIPNVRLVEQGNSLGYGSFYIRGAGVSPSVPSFDPAVGVVIDGVPMAQAGTGVLDVFDLETVEILRGPQGTLFGKNVSGGVVNTRTVRPNGEFGFKNIYAGVPVVIGNEGVEKIVELNLDKNEKVNFDLSVQAVKELFEAAIKIDNDLAK